MGTFTPLLSPSSSGPLFLVQHSLSWKKKLKRDAWTLLRAEIELTVLLSHLICGSTKNLGLFFFLLLLDSETLFHFKFLSLRSSQPRWLFCIWVSQLSPPRSLSLAFSFHFSLTLFSLPTPGVIRGCGVGSKTPLKCLLHWDYFKKPFHHVHEAALETKLKHDLPECESRALNSLESFVVPLACCLPLLFLSHHVSFYCLSVMLQLAVLTRVREVSR